jgi:para-aminobenzoate synthetase/4-amino-4-deoxychorismate lyase
MFGARYDDIINGQSFELIDGITTLSARASHEVPGLLAAAQQAAMDGRWVGGYLTYEAAAAFDPAFVVNESDTEALAWFGVFGARREVPAAIHNPAESGAYVVSQWRPGLNRDQYGDAFDQIQRHILDGDTYQVNFTFPLHAAFTGDPDVFYNDLVCAQRPRYAAHLWHDDTHVLSVSPEKFFTVSGRTIEAQPMKGTAARGRTVEEDLAYRDSLIASEKDIAENLMIVDLIRNDIGKVAEPGSVATRDLFSVERYRTVWQMISTVEATLSEDVSLPDVFAALFPSGSVTGAPKARSMEIIANLERRPRGVYCGSVGFIPPGDGLDGASFNVAIRTVEIDYAEGVARYGVGGGITWGSTVDNEFDEAVTKFEVLRFDVSPMALIEAIRWDDGWRWLDDHLDRLEASSAYWSFVFDRATIQRRLGDIESTIEGPSKVRIVCGSAGEVDIGTEDAPKRWASGPGPSIEPVTVSIDTEPIDDSNTRIYHKTTDRRAINTRIDRHPESDDVLMVNRLGRITESSIANVAFLIEGEWLTPPVLDGLLGGVMRSHLVEDGTLTERSISIPEALSADAVALVSALRGWRPAVIVSQRTVDS